MAEKPAKSPLNPQALPLFDAARVFSAACGAPIDEAMLEVIYARMGDAGGISLFGSKSEPHRLLIEHLLSEYRVKTEGRGRVVDEWKQRPERIDNHWWDGLVGCAVGASILGVTLPGTQVPAERRTVTRTLAQWAALARGEKV